MDFQQDTQLQQAEFELHASAVTEPQHTLSVDERVNQMSQQFWQELNDLQGSEFPILGIWK